MAEKVIKTTPLLDRRMKEVFDWSDADNTVRDELWDYFMEENGRDTIKAEEDMLPFIGAEDLKIVAFVNENLKK